MHAAPENQIELITQAEALDLPQTQALKVNGRRFSRVSRYTKCSCDAARAKAEAENQVYS